MYTSSHSALKENPHSEPPNCKDTHPPPSKPLQSSPHVESIALRVPPRALSTPSIIALLHFQLHLHLHPLSAQLPSPTHASTHKHRTLSLSRYSVLSSRVVSANTPRVHGRTGPSLLKSNTKQEESKQVSKVIRWAGFLLNEP